ncbi:MAG TPA: hypothetical protein ENJ08_02745 [Gammaproteobacteria bacterium]|nr:hypothetical protein [Gammaproteobacteria bacterium]
MPTRKTYFIDFEAPSLSHDSWPIEIAWGNDINAIESYLISPETIRHWTDWSNPSQKIHGIPHEELIEYGDVPGLVCEKIYAALDNQLVYSDTPAFNMDWLRKLFDGASLPMPDFIIKDIDALS